MSSNKTIPGRAATWPTSFHRHGGAREGENEQGKSDVSQLVVAPVLREFGLVEHRGEMTPFSAAQDYNVEFRHDRCTKIPPSIAPHDRHFSRARELSFAA